MLLSDYMQLLHCYQIKEPGVFINGVGKADLV